MTLESTATMIEERADWTGGEGPERCDSNEAVLIRIEGDPKAFRVVSWFGGEGVRRSRTLDDRRSAGVKVSVTGSPVEVQEFKARGAAWRRAFQQPYWEGKNKRNVKSKER